MSKEKRVVFFEGKSWYHRIKELQDDLTTKYGKKGGFETDVYKRQSLNSTDVKNEKNQKNTTMENPDKGYNLPIDEDKKKETYDCS